MTDATPSPQPPRKRNLLVPVLAVVAVLAAAGAAAFFLWPASLPAPGSARYEAYVEAFQLGTARLDVGMNVEALEHLNAAVAIVPGEPAGWANRGLVHLRAGNRVENLVNAEADLNRAAALAPADADIAENRAVLYRYKGQLAKAIEALAVARKATPGDPRRLYLQTVLVREGAEPDAENNRDALIDELAKLRPESLPVLLEQLRNAGRRRDKVALADAVARMGRLVTPAWPEQPRKELAEFAKDAAGLLGDNEFGPRVDTLKNVFAVVPGFPRDLAELTPDNSAVGKSIQQVLRLAPVRLFASPADAGVTFAKSAFPAASLPALPAPAVVTRVATLRSELDVVPVVADADSVRFRNPAEVVIPFPAGAAKVPPRPEGILVADLHRHTRWRMFMPKLPDGAENPDYRSDVVLAGAGGLRVHIQRPDGTFVDSTAATKLPAGILNGDHFGAWAADVEMDGDLDVVLATRGNGVYVLRNNFDGTYAAVTPFADVTAARAFVWVDLDNDGAADAVFLDDAGKLHVFMNQRRGNFRRRAVPADLTPLAAVTAADVTDDGVFDLILLGQDGTLSRLSDSRKGDDSWEPADLSSRPPSPSLRPGGVRLVACDLDLNGATDVVQVGPEGGRVWLADEKSPSAFTLLDAAVPPGVSEVANVGESVFALVGVAEGKPSLRTVTRPKAYSSYSVRPRANIFATGEQLINSFAVGSEVEIRSGSLVTKLPILGAETTFGLGAKGRVLTTRFVWTNGTEQIEFDKPGGVIRVDQRLKGSCPFLFTDDGEKMTFVTDFCWSTPLGLYINAQKRGGGFVETTEYVRIRGDQLKARHGRYDVRVQANLWETHYLDHLSLKVVDHPDDTEVFADERFFLTPTKARYVVTGKPRPFASVRDHHGNNVAAVVAAVDGSYLDDGERGLYQGVRPENWAECVLPADAPKAGRLYLIAQGWLQPTDSSVNAALAQSPAPPPLPLVLEIPDGAGGWKSTGPPLGFPAGKNKSVVVRLDEIPGVVAAGRFRVRTTMEVYWDALRWAVGRPEAAVSVKDLLPETAELRYRGLVAMSRKDRSSPETPDYDRVVTTRQAWRDLVGYHTRFGDVKELLDKVDDRYVLLNAGDEIRLTFAAPAGPAAGTRRDFLWVSDGWTKDGDFNTTHSRTVLPLPSHSQTDYDAPPGRLEDDPVYRRHAKDWRTYHTRFISPMTFERGLRSFK